MIIDSHQIVVAPAGERHEVAIEQNHRNASLGKKVDDPLVDLLLAARFLEGCKKHAGDPLLDDPIDDTEDPEEAENADDTDDADNEDDAEPIGAAAPEEPVVKPQVVAALEQPQVESDAQPDPPVKLKGPIAALYLAPLPPRRPSNLELLVALRADIPLPPVRPADLSAPSQTATNLSPPLPPVRPAQLALLSPDAWLAPDIGASLAVGPAARPPERAAANPSADGPSGDGGQLPSVITQGVTVPPPSAALALAELPPSPVADPNALLERAAELSAPLPPLPIPNVDAPTAAAAPAQPRQAGLADELAKLFGSLRAPKP